MVMRRSSAWRKNNLREIKKTPGRYFAILAIIALGVGFFSGLIITKPAMVKTLDKYVTEHKMYDFRLLSTLGLTDEDVSFFNAKEGMTAEGALSIDFMAALDEGEEEIILKAHSVTESVSLLSVRQGRLPKAANECVLDARMFSDDVIGTKIKVSESNDKDTKDLFAYDEYEVVGLVNSVHYISYDRGTTGIGTGSVHAFAFIPIEGFDVEYFTEIQLWLPHDFEIYSEEYEDFISSREEIVKAALEERADLRYKSIVDEAMEKIADGQKEYDEAYEEYLKEKADAEKELEDAKKELEDAEKKIREEEEKLLDGEKKLLDGEKEYLEAVKEYEESLADFTQKEKDAYAALDAAKQELQQQRLQVESGISQIEKSGVLEQFAQLTETIASLKEALSMISPSLPQYQAFKMQLAQAEVALQRIHESGALVQYEQLKGALVQIEEGEVRWEREKEMTVQMLEEGKAKLSEGKIRLDDAKAEIDKNKKDIEEGKKAIQEAKEEYEKGLLDYEKGKKEADEAFQEAEEELAKALKDLENARKEVEDIPKPKTFILDRTYNQGYASFENDSSILEGIGKVLPVFFFLVAAMVCSVTMTRMTDEHRTQIGTLKALGYGDFKIARKYMTYAGSAALIGCVIGYFMGTKYFPMAIWAAYSMIYDISSIAYIHDIRLAVISLAVSFLCSVGVTYVSCKSELLQMPAELIRPKAPKPGKRVLLERIPVIWSRLQFVQKVSIRNIFRYKRRLLMTVLGVAGCMSMVVAALGIKNSVSNVVNDQFDNIMIYDFNIRFSEGQTSAERAEFIKTYKDVLSECAFVLESDIEAVKGESIKTVTMVATDDPNITSVVRLYSKSGNMPYPSDGKAVLSHRLAENFNIAVGDTITVRINDLETADIPVEGIFENYMGNFLFMTGNTYKAFFEKEPSYQNAYASTDKEDLYSVSALLTNDDSVASVTVLYDLRVMVDNMMESLNRVVTLVIFCAAALSFVVIYNLNNINITERAREIATIKVLGFYPYETEEYIFRETLILTAISVIIGLGLGKLLHQFVMDQIRVDAVSFKYRILWSSYFIGAAVTFVITFLVNLMLRKKIDNIKPAESLKSVE
jgi:putative ABC transport system permease protein